jgi:transposase
LEIPPDDRSPFDDEPSYQDLVEENAALQLVTVQQAVMIAKLEAKLADLEERLGRNPRNSSMPPSAEGFSKPPAPSRAERRAAARKQGKQPGTPGKHLAQVVDPDRVVNHAPPSCTSCGSGLDDAEVVDTERRQVFDLPEIRLVVTEHIVERRRCRCGCTTKAEFPRTATAPACYGPGIRALAAYLAVHQDLPMDRMAQLFSDVLSAPVSVGALSQMVTEAADATQPFLDATRLLLREVPVVHFDETGGRAVGRLHWVHSASTRLLTLIDCHPKRGRAAMDDLGVIGAMAGVAVHDGWKPYRHYDIDHGLCNAHHLRELEAVGIGWDQGWANDLVGLVIEAKHATGDARAAGVGHLDAATLHSIRVRYGQLVAKGFVANPAPAVGKRAGYEKKAFNLLRRLDEQRADVLRFVTDFNVPFDNNQAERDIRMVKLQQKISGSWRTLEGARNFCAIRSYASTLRKHDRNVLAGLRQLFDSQAWLPAPT